MKAMNVGSDLVTGFKLESDNKMLLKSLWVNEPSCLQGDKGCTFRMQSLVFVVLHSQQTVKKTRNCCGKLETCAAVQLTA
jgi:hypothetical protein